MELTALAIAAVTLMLSKAGEAFSEKIGEGFWNLLTKPFYKEEDKAKLALLVKEPENQNLKEDVIKIMESALITDKTFYEEVKEAIFNAKKEIRQVNQHGEKSLYFEENKGNITIN